MKIIDKGSRKDFYDYIGYQFADDTNTFDRRKAYQLSKDELASYETSIIHRTNDSLYVLCIGYTKFLFKVLDAKSSVAESNYRLELIDVWKDYTSRYFMSLKTPNFSWMVRAKKSGKFESEVELIKKNQVELDDFRRSFGYNEDNGLVLKGAGFASILDPETVYYALDEYYSSLKNEAESRESKDLDDVGKAINHGFDKKTSFRNVK